MCWGTVYLSRQIAGRRGEIIFSAWKTEDCRSRVLKLLGPKWASPMAVHLGATHAGFLPCKQKKHRYRVNRNQSPAFLRNLMKWGSYLTPTVNYHYQRTFGSWLTQRSLQQIKVPSLALGCCGLYLLPCSNSQTVGALMLPPSQLPVPLTLTRCFLLILLFSVPVRQLGSCQ